MSDRAEKERRRQQRLARERAKQARDERRRDLRWYGASLAVVALAAVVVLIGLSNRAGGGDPAPLRAVAQGTRAVPAPPTRGVPRQIRANLAQGDRVVDGRIAERLAGLRGVPVVVNMWASWCPNCKAEFPFFQGLSRKYVRRVAFVGLDSQDDRGAAVRFLAQFPVAYPSIFDPSAAQAQSIGAGRGWPTTLFYDRTGRQTFVRQGGYTTQASLEADLRRYALGA